MEMVNHMRRARIGIEKVKTRAPTSTWCCQWLWSQPITQSPEVSTNSNQL